MPVHASLNFLDCAQEYFTYVSRYQANETAATPLDKQISIYSVTYGTDLMQRRNRVHVRVQSHANASAITRECE